MNKGKFKLTSIYLFGDIDTKLFFGFKCSAGNSSQKKIPLKIKILNGICIY